jgi:hypothetical protein
MSGKRRIHLLLACMAVLAACVGTVGSAPGDASAPSSARGIRALADTGTLTLAAELAVEYGPTACPPGAPSSVECYARTGTGLIRGLGSVDESYPYLVDGSPAGCTPDQVRLLPATVRLSVAGKGDLELRVGGTGCVDRIPPNPLRAEAGFTITGGSGKYLGASGGGTYSDFSTGPPSFRGRDTWNGTLVVPGLDFDLIPPGLTGGANKTIRVPKRVKRVRVGYTVTAQDDVEGALPVTCQPKSRSWFKVGRTQVRCSATDTSANESKVAFVITVKRRR